MILSERMVSEMTSERKQGYDHHRGLLDLRPSVHPHVAPFRPRSLDSKVGLSV